MKTTALFAMIAALAIVVGAYSATQQQAERDAWAAEHDRLSAKVETLELQVAEEAKRKSQQQADNEPLQKLTDANAQLSAVEAEILHYRAELVQLKSDRLVAEERVRSSLDTLRRQVRKATEIEQGLSSLQSQKLQIRHHVGKAEQQMNELADTIAARQDYAASLDQKIAELVVRQEAMSSRLDLAEQQGASRTIAANELEAIKGPSIDQESAAATTRVAAFNVNEKPQPKTAGPAKEIPAIEEDNLDQDRSKGLYRFKSLNAERGTGGPAPASEDNVKLAARSDDLENNQLSPQQWATKQYELGRLLVTRGERNSGTRELNEAVLAFKAALGEWSKREDTLRWSATQNDLGYALALLGQRQQDVGILEDAAIASRHALSEVQRKQTPILWATAQYNLGLALSSMAAIKADKALWQNAIKALQQSAEVFASEGAKAEADKSVYRLQDAHDQLAALRKAS